MNTATPNGFCFLFAVKEAVGKGLGVFAAETIKQGCIVWRHVPGNFTVYDEPLFKAAISKLTHNEVVYELTHTFGLKRIRGCVIRLHDEGVLINHSSSANLETNNARPIKSTLDTASDHYIHDVATALLDDRFALVATRDIELGEEFTTDYAAECDDPPWFDAVHEKYGVDESYLDIC